jgi:hypothetical protein
MRPDAIFVQDGDRFQASELALGPWAADALHGGAPAALLVHTLEAYVAGQVPGLSLARLTIEFVRPVPRRELSVAVAVVRPGRRVTLLDATLSSAEHGEVTRARALFLAPSEIDVTTLSPPPFPGPNAAEGNDWRDAGAPMFATHAMEIRFVQGRFGEPGAATAWFRLRHPLIGGQPLRAMERLAAAADFGNGIASVLSWEDHVFINADLTLHLERPPTSEWVALQSEMRVLRGSVATAESVLWDETGRLGRAVQSLLVAPRG